MSGLSRAGTRRGARVAARLGLPIACAALMLAHGSGGSTYAVALRESGSRAGEFSPLFSRRLEVGVRDMDAPADRAMTVAWERALRDPLATPLSGNPVSACLGSACTLSYCLGSACLSSRCLGSACMVSACGGSACITSACGGSGCLGSVCGGSLCVGSVCASLCAGCGAPDPGSIETHG